MRYRVSRTWTRPWTVNPESKNRPPKKWTIVFRWPRSGFLTIKYNISICKRSKRIFLGSSENILEYFLLVWTKLRFSRKFNYSNNSEQFLNFRKFTGWCVWIIVHTSSNGTCCIERTGLNLFEIVQSSLESRNQKTFPTFSHLSNKFKTGVQKLKSEKIVTSYASKIDQIESRFGRVFYYFEIFFEIPNTFSKCFINKGLVAQRKCITEGLSRA